MNNVMSKIFLKTFLTVLIGAGLFSSLQAAAPMPSVVVPNGLSGEPAIAALGGSLDAVAAHYGQTANQLRSSFRSDASMHINGLGYLYYSCSGLSLPVGSGALLTPPALLFPLTNTFFLHSKPGSTKTIYLDFVGYTLHNTSWNVDFNGGIDIVAPPYDTDGNPAAFSASEQSEIQQAWFRVAEDYAIFDVDVTTEYPGEAAITRSDVNDQVYGERVLISPISSFIAPAGGIAYVGVFNEVGDFHKPALIFPENLAQAGRYIGEAISHEVGHNLSLHHQGTDVNGTHTEYYAGRGNWAPIMGVSYYKSITQWAKGEYQDANNHEDALALITSTGLNYRAADFGGSLATATLMRGINSRTNGIIAHTGEKDFFYFQTGSGLAQVAVTNWPESSDLHELVTIYDSNGNQVASSESIDDMTGGTHGVTFQFPVTAGKYSVAIAGTNNGNALTTGYSSYGSVGQYNLSITNPLGVNTTFSAPVGPWGSTLSVMNGSNPNGLWFLFVQDDAVFDTGMITNGWYATLVTANPVGYAADNAIYAAATNATIPYGGNYALTLAVTNYGPSISSNVFVTDELPVSGFSLVASNHTAGAVALFGSVLTWSLGTLQPNEGATLTLSLHGISGGIFTNTATVSSSTPDPNPDDDTIASLVTVAVPPVPPVLSGFSFGTGGFRLTVTGDSNYPTIVQASTNLINWVSIYTNTPTFTFTNLVSPNYPMRFYRAVVGP